MGMTPPEEGSALYIVFGYVFPCLGVLISCLFSLSPIPRLKIINRDGKLRDFDPFPTVLNLGSGISWLCYSVMAVNPFCFTSGAVAAASSTYALLVSHANADKPARYALERLTMCLMGVYISASLAVMLLQNTHPGAALATVGLLANLLCLAVYFAPLQHAYKVIQTKDSSSIYAPWSALQLLNASLWSLYGLCVFDVWILISSLLGVFSALVALCLRGVYPAKVRRRSSVLVMMMNGGQVVVEGEEEEEDEGGREEGVGELRREKSLVPVPVGEEGEVVAEGGGGEAHAF